jgi:uncharacterized lipoprotein YbaY
MKATWILAGLALAAAGCANVQLDTQGEGDPNRVVVGTVELGDAGPLPDGAVVAVRVEDAAQTTYRSPTAVLGEPSAAVAPGNLPPKLLGQQTIRDVSGSSIPFRVPYYATDEQLRIGLILQARISVAGKVRYYNVNSYSLNLSNANDPHAVYVNTVRE